MYVTNFLEKPYQQKFKAPNDNTLTKYDTTAKIQINGRPLEFYLYFKIGSICLCHGQHAISDCRYFLAPCDKHKHTGHAQQQAGSQASMDSAWRHPAWLLHISLGFQCPVGRRSYRNKPRLTGEVYVTPQVTIAGTAIVACYYYYYNTPQYTNYSAALETL